MIESFPTRGGLTEQRLWATEKLFRANAGSGWEFRQIGRSISYVVTKMIRFMCGCFPMTFMTRMFLCPVVRTNLKPSRTIRLFGIFSRYLRRWTSRLGASLRAIDELNLGKRTLILFTSDNGPTDWPNKYKTGPPAGYTGPFRGRKWSLFEGGIRMPFIARWTGTIPAGVEDKTSVMAAIDVSPTICRFVGVPTEDDLDGVDRGDVLLGEPSRRSKPLFWQYGHPHAILKGGKSVHQSPTMAMRDGRWKFLVNPDGSESQLFDLETDKAETSNLLSTYPERATAMAGRISAWAGKIGFAFDEAAALTAPGPTIAILASNQLLRFENHGVTRAADLLKFDGKSWLDLPAFRAPKVAGGRSLQIKGTIRDHSRTGVILAHGGNRAGYSVYLSEGHLCFATCVNKKTQVGANGLGDRRVDPIRGELESQRRDVFESQWQACGEGESWNHPARTGGLNPDRS